MKRTLRIHLTNVLGAGAVEVARALLPELEKQADVAVEYLPDSGPLSRHMPATARTRTEIHRRRLPKPLSRIVECTLLSGRFSGDSPLLVLGDIPLRLPGRQIVLVHTPHLLAPQANLPVADKARFLVARRLFSANHRFADRFIVQSEAISEQLERRYPGCRGKTVVIPPTVPDWLAKASGERPLARRRPGVGEPLRLFYPARPYPHKNHARLLEASELLEFAGDCRRLVLTMPPPERARRPDTVAFVGELGPQEMQTAYCEADALIFPSTAETIGLPLLEAMALGLPVLAADLPYARAVCADQAIYFDPGSAHAIAAAVTTLRARLDNGWRPDWAGRLSLFPRNWAEIAARFVRVIESI